jgi:hypothetical protein
MIGKSLIALSAIVVIFTSASAFAQAPGSTTGAGVDAREANQQQRIEQGIKSGTLTPKETQKLERRENSISRQEDRMRARDGGQLTAKDRAVLDRRLDNTSNAIFNKKHN